MSEIGVRIQEKGQVTIPSEIRKKLNLKRGDLVVFQETDAGVVIKPASVIVSDELRKEVAALVRSVRKRFRDYSAEELDALINEAIREAREKRD